MRGRKVKSRDCALASDLVRAPGLFQRPPRAKEKGDHNMGARPEISGAGIMDI